MQTAHELFLHELGDMLDAEKKLVEALGEQAEESSRPEVKKAFEMHQRQTEGQVERLQRALVHLGYMTSAQVRAGLGVFGPVTQSAFTVSGTADVGNVDVSGATEVGSAGFLNASYIRGGSIVVDRGLHVAYVVLRGVRIERPVEPRLAPVRRRPPREPAVAPPQCLDAVRRTLADELVQRRVAKPLEQPVGV